MPRTKADHTHVIVAVIPNCDLPHDEPVAAYADTKLSSGPWAYVCEWHFEFHDCELGLGKGQVLITRHPDADSSWRPNQTPCSGNDYACQYCGKPGGH